MFNRKEKKRMKKFYSLLIAAVALIGLAACESNQAEQTLVENGKMSFVASFDETRTALGEDGASVVWNADDMICVSDGVDCKPYTTADNGVSAIFSGDPFAEGTKKFYAFYPYDIANTDLICVDGEWGGYEVVKEQVATIGTFAPRTAISTAVSEDGKTLSFKNECAVLKFQVPAYEQAIESVEFYNGEELVVEMVGQMVNGNNYYAVVMPGSYTFTVNINGEVVKVSEITLELEANHIYNLKELPAATKPFVPEASEYGVVGSFQGWDVVNPVVLYTTESEWLVATGVEFFKGDEFKFVKGNSWDVSYGFSEAGVAAVDTEHALVVAGSQNIKANKNGKFDIYFALDGNTAKFYYTCVEEYTDLTVDITIDNKAGWEPLYIVLKDGDKFITAESGDLVVDSKYTISGEYIGSSLSYYFISGDKTSDVAKVTIAKTGAAVTLEENVIKLVLQLDTANAKQWWGDVAKIHVWNTGTSFDTTWPGNEMVNEGNYTWSIIVPSELVGKTINYLIHNGNGWQSNDSKITISAEGNTVKGSSININ